MLAVEVHEPSHGVPFFASCVESVRSFSESAGLTPGWGALWGGTPPEWSRETPSSIWSTRPSAGPVEHASSCVEHATLDKLNLTYVVDTYDRRAGT